MPESTPRILRSRVVLPICRPPINDGAVVVAGPRIVAVGRWRPLRKRFSSAHPVDFGESILLPGLVNAHCHLDYTHMAGLFPPQKSFCDWIKLITTEKAQWTFSDFAESWIDGAKMLVRTGTTTVADIETVPELLPDVWETTPLRVISFLEMTGVRSRRNPKSILGEAVDKISSLPRNRCFAALSPHAPYSTTPQLLKLAATAARRRRLPLSIHVSESATEFEMFMHGCGEMHEWLRRDRDTGDCGDVSPLQHLANHDALGRNTLAIHVNYLAHGDAKLLAAKKTSVVHCPRSRDYFAHSEFPFTRLEKAGVNICLGTDSLASVRKSSRQSVQLSMFDEMRAFASTNSGVQPQNILKMATLNGAVALGLRDKTGSLRPNAQADLIVIPAGDKSADPHETVVHHRGDISAGMIGGEWTITPR